MEDFDGGAVGGQTLSAEENLKSVSLVSMETSSKQLRGKSHSRIY